MPPVERRKLVITHPEKLIFPDVPLHKEEVIDYYSRIAPYILPHLKDRPLTLWRFPKGINEEGFVIKDAPLKRPSWVKTWPQYIPSKKEEIHWLLANDVETLRWIANYDGIEMHPWLSRVDRPNYPDLIVFDLDPEPEASFSDLAEVAWIIKDYLANFHLKAYLKTSGKRGLHVYLPIKREYGFPKIRQMVKAIVLFLDGKYPNLISTEWKKEKRKGLVHIDFLQNSFGKTMVSVYSLRALPGAPVSCPLEWDELKGKIRPGDFNWQTIFSRIKEVGDLFSHVLENFQKIDPEAFQMR